MTPDKGLRLTVFPPEGEPFHRVVQGEEIVVGRSSKAGLLIPDRMLSREHARFMGKDGEWFVEDMGSHNGTFLNGARLQGRAKLKAGDSLGLGGSTITLTDGPASQSRDDSFGEGTVFRSAAEVLRQGMREHAEGREADREALRASLARLRVLNEVHQALARSISQKELLDLILDRAFNNLHPEEGAVFLTSKSGTYYCAASRAARGEKGPMALPRSLVREVAEKGMAALVLDVQTDDRFAGAQSIVSAGVRSLVAAPLMDAEGVLGMIVLSTTLAVKQYTEEDMELLVSLAAVAALRIRNVALAEEAAEAKRLEQELALARRIQLALLPDRLPEIPGYEVHGGNLPSRGVSGDYYEVLTRKEGTECVLWVADVCGKGMSAALLTASLEALAAGLIEEGLGPDDIFSRVSHLLYQRTPPEKYATAFLAVLDVATGTVRYSNAGHCRGLVIRADGSSQWLDPTGVPLGILDDWKYKQDHVSLAAGDLFILYTDGITEAMNPESEEYDTERLAACCAAHRTEPIKNLAKAIEADTDGFVRGVPYNDDRTLVMLRRGN